MKIKKRIRSSSWIFKPFNDKNKPLNYKLKMEY